MAIIREHCGQIGLDFVELGYFPVSFDGGVSAVRLVRDSGASAVVVNNDLITLGVVSTLIQDRVSVPADISVVAVGHPEFAVSCHPQLTGVHIPIHDIGRRAVDLLVAHCTDPDVPPQEVVLDTPFVVRSSTGPLKSTAVL